MPFGRLLLRCLVVGGAAFGALGCGSSFATSDDDTAGGGGTTGTGATTSTGGATGTGATSSTGGTSSSGGGSQGGSSSGGDTSTGGTVNADECTASTPCSSGVCTGNSCEEPWSCAPTNGGCTKDLVQYCGCDGTTFMDSGTCPTRPYSNKGACTTPELVDCNPAHITCLPIIAPPECPEGQVYSVENNCHGDCVPIGQCACNSHEDCPDPQNIDQYACHNNTGACGDWVR
jgi:hypothetical protein